MKATLSVQKRIEVKESRVDGILNYDIDNSYPNRVIDIINNSVTGTASVNLYSKFIQGKGFKDQKFYKIQVNSKGLTNDKFLRKLSDSFSHGGYMAIHVNYNALFEIVELTPIPFQFIRLSNSSNIEFPNRVVVYDNWDKRKNSRIKKDDFQYFRHFNPNPVQIASEVAQDGGWDKYQGQVWFVSKEGANYVLAPCDTVLEDMQTEAQAKVFKYRNIKTNFLASHFLIVDKKENSGIERSEELTNNTDDNGAIIRKRSREDSQQQEAFIQSIVDFQGADDAMKIAVIEKDYPEQTFELKKAEIQDVEDLYQFTESSVRDNIARCFNIPPILIGIKESNSLGVESKQRKGATDFYNSVTEGERIMFEEIFKTIFTFWHDKTANPSDDYSIIPIEVKEDNMTADILNVLNSSASIEEKKGRLITLFNFTDEEANKMVIQTTIAA